MSETADNARSEAFRGAAGEEDPAAMERRIFRSMCVAVALAVVVGALVAPWRVTTGILIGGVLSLFNHHWLRTSVAAAFDATDTGAKPKLRIARYILRYLVAAAIIAAAHQLEIASLTAMLLGMCSFVVAALLEGFIQLIFSFIHREEI
ncbi:MAG TPA: ATP synthase subunit I [Pyrinomonadaceae bacterium]|jgi:diacylglycerol kinase